MCDGWKELQPVAVTNNSSIKYAQCSNMHFDTATYTPYTPTLTAGKCAQMVVEDVEEAVDAALHRSRAVKWHSMR